MDTLTNNNNSANIILDKAERTRILNLTQKCPFLKIGPIIPLANQYYGYCTILKDKEQSNVREIKYITDYCCNIEENNAYKRCKIWLASQSDLHT